MSFLRHCFLLSLVSGASLVANAQAPVQMKEPRILLLVDASSSMLYPWDGKANRFATAARLVEGLMDSMYRVNPNVEFALRVYGQQSPVPDSNCYDTRREVMFSKNNRDQMGLRLASLQPRGVSPIAYSLQQAAEEDLTDEHRYSYSIILITDGGESCGGDLCAVARELEQRAIFFKPYIISMVDYAPLATQYQCLGNYLTLARPEQMRTTIQTIVDAYRPAFRKLSEMPVSAPVAVTPPPPPPPPPPLQPTPPRTEAPPVALETPYAVRPFPVSVPVLQNAVLRTIPPAPRITSEANPVAVALPTPPPPTPPPAPPVVPAPEPFVPAAVLVPRPSVLLPPRPVTVPAPAVARVLPTLAPPRIEATPEPPPQPWVAVASLPVRTVYQPAPVQVSMPVAVLRTIPNVAAPAREAEPVEISPLTFILRRHRIADAPTPRLFAGVRPIPNGPALARIAEPPPVVTITPVTPPPPPPVPKPTPAPKPAPAPPVAGGPKNAEFTVSSEPAAASGLQLYFTDGRGTFYQSTPQIEIQEPSTGKVVKKFYRTLGPTGDPDLQTIPPGTYNVVVTGKANLMARNVTIGVSERKNVTIKVTSGSLRFSYTGNPKRPVSEFQAAVVRRFADNNDLVKQACTDELSYEPGNYYLEINTLPVTRRNLDIDFGSTTEISINEPGWVQFTNTAALDNKVTLYAPLGDGFASFLQLNISGNLAEQKVRLQPGTYEARWIPGPAGTTPTIVRFLVKSNQTTTTLLQ